MKIEASKKPESLKADWLGRIIGPQGRKMILEPAGFQGWPIVSFDFTAVFQSTSIRPLNPTAKLSVVLICWKLWRARHPTWVSMCVVFDFAEKPALAGLALEGSRLRLPEAFRTPKAFGAASSAPPSFSPEDAFSAESSLGSDPLVLAHHSCPRSVLKKNRHESLCFC